LFSLTPKHFFEHGPVNCRIPQGEGRDPDLGSLAYDWDSLLLLLPWTTWVRRALSCRSLTGYPWPDAERISSREASHNIVGLQGEPWAGLQIQGVQQTSAAITSCVNKVGAQGMIKFHFEAHNSDAPRFGKPACSSLLSCGEFMTSLAHFQLLSLPLSKSLQNTELPSFSASNAAAVNHAFRPRHNPTSFVV